MYLDALRVNSYPVSEIVCEKCNTARDTPMKHITRPRIKACVSRKTAPLRMHIKSKAVVHENPHAAEASPVAATVIRNPHEHRHEQRWKGRAPGESHRSNDAHKAERDAASSSAW